VIGGDSHGVLTLIELFLDSTETTGGERREREERNLLTSDLRQSHLRRRFHFMNERVVAPMEKIIDNVRGGLKTIGLTVSDCEFEMRDESFNRISNNKHSFDRRIISEQVDERTDRLRRSTF
jgi:hypothetical protein